MSESQGGGHRFTEADLSDPIVILAQVRTEVIYMKEALRDNKELCGRMADDLTEIKIKLASTDGEKKGFLSGGRILNTIVILIASVGTAWATVKATLSIAATPPH